jgi:hypothetical protein
MPVRPFPIFNLSRHDLLWTLTAAVMCSCVAIILRSSQSDPPQGVTAWKDCTIIFCSVGAVVLAGLSVAKVCMFTYSLYGSSFVSIHMPCVYFMFNFPFSVLHT